ncbi:MAG: 2-polyprenyl-3-methyl-6-methoxy-1,4-benzoquinone monooxygenase [Gammaproteobacteria bacterium]|nr:2-polyprenyl-3-methyl-6-methoxy-1,4-benzoquinone monooxygenase [Gammaproteobacteria bacterium]
MTTRTLTGADRVIAALDQALRTVLGPHHSARPRPRAEKDCTASLSDGERRLAGSMMRVNHSGEVCAQALYQAQALTARSAAVNGAMRAAAAEENDHLSWCEQRIDALDARTSFLNPLWYSGSFAIGLAAGLVGDKWNLAFLAETERQVVRHLEEHLAHLPQNDTESRAVLLEMRDDEAKHATTAVKSGAAELPKPLKQLMGLAASVMTRTAAHL